MTASDTYDILYNFPPKKQMTLIQRSNLLFSNIMKLMLSIMHITVFTFYE